MRVRMITQMSGLRHDGEPWPGPGNEFEVPDEEGAALVHSGIAVPVAQERAKAETRPAPEDPAVEERAPAKAPKPKDDDKDAEAKSRARRA